MSAELSTVVSYQSIVFASRNDSSSPVGKRCIVFPGSKSVATTWLRKSLNFTLIGIRMWTAASPILGGLAIDAPLLGRH